MKRIVFALAFLLLSVPLTAQTYLTNTTLSAAITATQTQIRVASATSVAAGGGLFIDHEYLSISSVSGTTVTVIRAQRPSSHASGAVVYVATAAQRPNVLLTTNAAQRAGTCVLADQQFLPIIDIDTGDFYACRFASAGAAVRVWVKTNVQLINGVSSLPTAWP